MSLERTAQDCTHWCLQNCLSSTRHVSFLAAPDTDHQHKFSLTCLIYLPAFSPLQSCPFVLDPHVPCDDSRRSGGSTEVPSSPQSAVSVKRVYISKVIYNTETSCCSECTAGGTVSTVGVVSWVTQHHPREVALVPYPFSAQSFSFQGHFELSRLCCWSCSQHFSMSVPSSPPPEFNPEDPGFVLLAVRVHRQDITHASNSVLPQSPLGTSNIDWFTCGSFPCFGNQWVISVVAPEFRRHHDLQHQSVLSTKSWLRRATLLQEKADGRDGLLRLGGEEEGASGAAAGGQEEHW